MSQPAKPFLKPFSQNPAPPPAEDAPVTVAELTMYAVASGMHPDDRTAFLDHACSGNDVLRDKLRRRLAAQDAPPVQLAVPAPHATPTPRPAPVQPVTTAQPVLPSPRATAVPKTPRIAPPPPAAAPVESVEEIAAPPSPPPAPKPAPIPDSELQRIPEPLTAFAPDHPAGMALVPMSASQLAAITAQRQNHFPWITAVVLAVATGALSVILMQEKDARMRAETTGKEAAQRAGAAARDADAARAAAANQLTAAQTESEQLRAAADVQRQRAEAATRQAAVASADADRQRTALEAAAAQEKGGSEAGRAALAQAEKERDAIRASQKETMLSFAETLARLAAVQSENSRFADAEASARRSLEVRLEQGVIGWPLVESRTLLGAALLQRNADAEARREIASAADEIIKLGAPVGEADRARLIGAAKRIVQFHTATGRRKEASELKRQYDALARP